MAMGMMGMFIVHPKDRGTMPVDRDFVFLLAAYDIDPGSYAARERDDGLQHVDLQLARVPGHRSAAGARGRPRCGFASAT